MVANSMGAAHWSCLSALLKPSDQAQEQTDPGCTKQAVNQKAERQQHWATNIQLTGTAMGKHEAGAKEGDFVCLEYTSILNFLTSLEQLSAYRKVPGLVVYGTKGTS